MAARDAKSVMTVGRESRIVDLPSYGDNGGWVTIETVIADAVMADEVDCGEKTVDSIDHLH